MKKHAVVFLVILAVVLVAGCASQNTNTKYTEPNRTDWLPPTEGIPTVTITSPSDNEVINSTTVGIFINYTNFRLAAIANISNVRNEGHIHYWLNDEEKMSSSASIAFLDVAPGDYIVKAELRNNDHSPLAPPVDHSVRIKVSAGNRTISAP